MAGRARIHGPPPDTMIGTLFAWGDGFYGTLNNNLNSILRSSPIQVGSATDWKLGFCGIHSSMALRSGKLFAFGYNDVGQLGQGNRTNLSSPVQVGSNSDWKALSSNGADDSEVTHFGAIRGGMLFMWGSNSYGELARSPSVSAYSSPVQVGSGTDWTFVATANRFTLAIRSGKLFAWGYNSAGQLGQGNITNYSSPVQIGSGSDWTHVTCGYFGAHGIRGGKLFAWGDNSAGVLGDGSNPNVIFQKSSPVQIGAATDWSFISHGYFHAFGICQGALYAWGWNTYGQLGRGDSTWRSSPVQIGALTDWTAASAGWRCSAGLRAGRLFTWGYNGTGNLGLGDITNRLSPVQVGSATNWLSAVAGVYHMLGIRAP